jgi:hypothetical protein
MPKADQGVMRHHSLISVNIPRSNEQAEMGQKECQWQRDQLPEEIRELVLDDQKLRSYVCWNVFDPFN